MLFSNTRNVFRVVLSQFSVAGSNPRGPFSPTKSESASKKCWQYRQSFFFHFEKCCTYTPEIFFDRLISEKFFSPKNWRKLILYIHRKNDASLNDPLIFAVRLSRHFFFVKIRYSMKFSRDTLLLLLISRVFLRFIWRQNMFGFNEVYVFLTQVWILCVLFFAQTKFEFI